jgi:hypothetical protein
LFDDFRDYAIKNYHRIYPVSLSLNDRNLNLAYKAYDVGVIEGLSRMGAVIHTIGYRYRRLENFLHEIGAYNVGVGWAEQIALVKNKGLYSSSRERLSFDFEIKCMKPFSLDHIEKDFMDFIFFECLAQTPFALTPVELKNWEYDIVGHDYEMYSKMEDECEAKMAVRSSRGYEYEYGFTVTVTKFHIFGSGRRGQRGHVFVVYEYEKPL